MNNLFETLSPLLYLREDNLQTVSSIKDVSQSEKEVGSQLYSLVSKEVMTEVDVTISFWVAILTLIGYVLSTLILWRLFLREIEVPTTVLLWE